MKSLMYGVAVLLLVSVAISCQPKDPEPRLRNAIGITDQLYASFEVLDMDGQPRTTFKEGENFQLSFKFRNVSDDTLNTILGTPPLSRLFFTEDRNFFSVLNRIGSGQADQTMGRPIDAPFTSEGFYAGGVWILPKTTVVYQVEWKTQINGRYPMPIYDPVPGPENKWYIQKFVTRTGLENKVENLPKGVYYSFFIIDVFGKRVPFRVIFTIN